MPTPNGVEIGELLLLDLQVIVVDGHHESQHVWMKDLLKEPSRMMVVLPVRRMRVKLERLALTLGTLEVEV